MGPSVPRGTSHWGEPSLLVGWSWGTLSPPRGVPISRTLCAPQVLGGGEDPRGRSQQSQGALQRGVHLRHGRPRGHNHLLPGERGVSQWGGEVRNPTLACVSLSLVCVPPQPGQGALLMEMEPLLLDHLPSSGQEAAASGAEVGGGLLASPWVPPPAPCPPPSLSHPAPSFYLQVRAETRRNHCPSWSPPGWGCPCPLLSHVGCPGDFLAPWINLVRFRTSCLFPKRHPGGEGQSDPLSLPSSWHPCEPGGTRRSAGTPTVLLTLSSLHGTATSPGTTACSQRRYTTSGGCASSSVCPPTPSTPPSGARKRWVPVASTVGSSTVMDVG